MAEYIITKSYGKWSSSTHVEVLEAPWLKGEKKRHDHMALVHHVPTKTTFEIPATILVPKRDRSGNEAIQSSG